MIINRPAIQKILNTVPQDLRQAARKERQVLIKETQKDPIGASFMAAKGELPFFNNNKLTAKLQEVNNKLAAESYAKNHSPEFVHRQPMGNITESADVPVVHASMNLG